MEPYNEIIKVEAPSIVKNEEIPLGKIELNNDKIMLKEAPIVKTDNNLKSQSS